MASAAKTQKPTPHAVCVPFPAQGHINPMLKLAFLLHRKGFHITFVHTEYNHNRLLKTGGTAAVFPLPDFQFATIPDGLPPPENEDSTQDIRSLCLSTREHSLAPLNELIDRLNGGHPRSPPPVSCVIADMHMWFVLDAADRIRVPGVLLQTSCAGDFMCNKNIPRLVEKGFVPFKDESSFTNGHLDKPQIDWVPGIFPLRLKDFCNFVIQTTDPNDALLQFVIAGTSRSSTAAAIIINTFDALEQNVLSALSTMSPPIYTVGSLHLLHNQPSENMSDDATKSMRSSLWREDASVLKWLDSKPENSVIYVNFGSIAVLTQHQLIELAWGLAGSERNFVWIVRPDSVRGENAPLPEEFWAEIRGRGFVAGWCPQEEVLGHAAVGGFLTHCGWNSLLESVCGGVPVLCWPLFADQNVNCRYACEEWGIGVEVKGGDVKRDELGILVRELMDGERGEILRKRAAEWKEKAAAAVACGGSSCLNLDRLITEVLNA
ncbi:hypothetical protein MIMGU_mgv1a021775mg [Erythranthe guttata]|uniref:Glycosyltransferase n=1 Tax=Erythranthe guttata TaxID=4155 RepID=A0A022RH72_ERYGU|nr:hypothetical protein MIMGU_mgv1a021775mg [Erythranthe guttata]